MTDGIESHLYKTQELLRSSLMEDCDGKLHHVRHLDLQGMVMNGVLDCVLLPDVGDGWLALS